MYSPFFARGSEWNFGDPPMAPLPTPGYPPATAPAYLNLNTPKVLGGLGCVLLLLTLVPRVGGLLGIAGLAFVGYALKRLSDAVREPKVFDNYLYALVSSVVGLVVGVVVVIATVLRVLGFENLANMDWAGWTPTTGQAVEIALGAIAGLVVMWVAMLLSAIFVRRAGDLLAARLNIPLFRTAGLVYLLGAALTVVLVGFVVVAIALLLFAVAFFTIPDRPVNPAYPTAQGGGA
jgi:uncharacterized membrane protein